MFRNGQGKFAEQREDRRRQEKTATKFSPNRQTVRSAKPSGPEWTAMPLRSWPLCPSSSTQVSPSCSQPPLVLLTDRNDKQIVKTGSWREQSEGSRPSVRFLREILLLLLPPRSPLRSYVVQARF